jgi:hypothetical protein
MNFSPDHHNSRFSRIVQESLTKAGWFPGRTVPEMQLNRWCILESHNGAGYCRIFPAALRALKEFGGLDIEPLETGELYETVRLRFDPLAARSFLGEEWFTYEWVLETSLYPLGLIKTDDHDHVMAIDQSGRIFSFYYELILVGNTLDEAIESCLTGSDTGEPVDFSTEKADEAVAIFQAIRDKKSQ